MTLKPAKFLETADIETSSAAYAGRFSGQVGAWFLQVQQAATLPMLMPYRGATILDVGGGHGQLTEALVGHGYEVTVAGSDAVCKARIQTFVESGQCKFDVVDFLGLPYPDQAFDVVISYRLLSHVTHQDRFIGELARVAAQAVIVDYPELRSVNYLAPRLFKYKKRLEGNTRSFTTFTRAQLLGLFKRHRFVYGAHYAEFFLPMVVHRKLKSPGLSRQLERMPRLLGLTDNFGSPVILKLVRDRGGSG